MTASINVTGANLGSSLQDLLMAEEMSPGQDVSYQLAKTIYLYHPLGAKMTESPITMAQSQRRDISIPESPEDRVLKAFNTEWESIGADKHIHNVMKQSRIYGEAAVAILTEGVESSEPLDFSKLYELKISFNVFDPLNTSGSLVLSQDPNSMDFLKTMGISVSGTAYHRSRSCVKLNEEPIYLGYTNSAFGYVGRSVYQRALYPLKSFVQTMITDDMVARKAGLLIAKIKQPGSIIDKLMAAATGLKRALLQEAATNNVLSIDPAEDIETLNMQNVNSAMDTSRNNIIKNIATAADMPAKLLTNESFVAGFGEGSEDAKHIADYIDHLREDMEPLYRFFDLIVMYRAWNPKFYETIQAEFPEEYGSKSYNEAFYQWRNSFTVEWPSLLKEAPSEEVKVDDTKLKAVISLIEVLMPELDPVNKAKTIIWATETFNDLKLLFPEPLILDGDSLVEWAEQQGQQGGAEGGDGMSEGDDTGGGRGGEQPAPDAPGGAPPPEPKMPKPKPEVLHDAARKSLKSKLGRRRH